MSDNNQNTKKANIGFTLMVIGGVTAFCLILFFYTLSKLSDNLIIKENQKDKITLNVYEEKILKHIHEKYPERTFKKGRGNGYCPLDNSKYGYCSMYVYEISNIYAEYNITLNLSTGEIKTDSYAKNVINNELAKSMVLNELKRYNLNVKSVTIEFYRDNNSDFLDDSSLGAFIQNNNPEAWMIWITINDDENLFSKETLLAILPNIYDKLSGEVGFQITIKNETLDVVKSVSGDISNDGIKINYSNVEEIKIGDLK